MFFFSTAFAQRTSERRPSRNIMLSKHVRTQKENKTTTTITKTKNKLKVEKNTNFIRIIMPIMSNKM
jgi:hypothetical protein